MIDHLSTDGVLPPLSSIYDFQLMPNGRLSMAFFSGIPGGFGFSSAPFIRKNHLPRAIILPHASARR
jgi:hypothetical protein